MLAAKRILLTLDRRDEGERWRILLYADEEMPRNFLCFPFAISFHVISGTIRF